MFITRFLQVQIYNVAGTAVEYDNNGATDWGITQGSIKLDKILMDGELHFGECNSSKLELQVFGLDFDLSKRKIKLTVHESYNEADYLEDEDDNIIITSAGDSIELGDGAQSASKVLFVGYINSSEKDIFSTDRNIIAYDWMFYHRDTDISSFWNTYWNTHAEDTVTLSDFRDSLMTYMGLTHDTVSLFNDALVITNSFVTQLQTIEESTEEDEEITTDTTTVSIETSAIPFGNVFSMICELQLCNPLIDTDFNNIKFYTLSTTVDNDVANNTEGANSAWEDFETDLITGVGIYDSSSSLAQLIGTTDNVYNFSGNLFLLNKTAQELTTIGNALLAEINTITYRPAEIKCIVSNLIDYELGQKIHTEKGNTYILKMSMDGSLLVEQTLECSVEDSKLNASASDYNDSIVSGMKVAVFEKNIDGMRSEFSDMVGTANEHGSRITQNADAIIAEVTARQNGDTNLSSRITQNAESITAEVSRAKLAEETKCNVIGYHIDTVEGIDYLVYETDLILTSPLAENQLIGVWLNYPTPEEYNSYPKQIAIGIQQNPEQAVLYTVNQIYYNGLTKLTNEYGLGAVLHLTHKTNQTITSDSYDVGIVTSDNMGIIDSNDRALIAIHTSTQTVSGFWIGADNSWSKITQTAEEIRAEVQSGFDGVNSTISQTATQIRTEVNGYVFDSTEHLVESRTNTNDTYMYNCHGLYDSEEQTYGPYDYMGYQLPDHLYPITPEETHLDETYLRLDNPYNLYKSNGTEWVSQGTVRIQSTRYRGVNIVIDLDNNEDFIDFEPYDGFRLAVRISTLNLINNTYPKYLEIRCKNSAGDSIRYRNAIKWNAGVDLTNEAYAKQAILHLTFTEVDDSEVDWSNFGIGDLSYWNMGEDKTYERVSSSITQLSNQIVLKVETETGKLVAVELNADPATGTEFKVEADNIDLSANDIFNIMAGGTLNLSANNITIDSTNFSVDSTGAVECNDLTVTGGEINLGNGVFSVTNAGKVTCTDITATGGTIGGWTISTTHISTGPVATNGTLHLYADPTGGYGQSIRKSGGWAPSYIANQESDLEQLLARIGGSVLRVGASYSGDYYAFGYITTSGQDLHIFVPLKNDGTGYSLNITALRSSLRLGNGYVGGGSNLDIFSNLDSALLIKGQQLAHIVCKTQGSWGTNNTPVVGYVTMSFLHA